MRILRSAGSVSLACFIAAACSASTETGKTGSGTHSAGGSGGAGGAGGTGNGGSSSTSGGCVDGAEQCVNGVHQICGGGVFSNIPCPSGQGCKDGGKCENCACTPGEVSPDCLDGATQQVCSPTCLMFDAVPCTVGQSCMNGTCLDQVCTPGEIHCKDTGSTEVCKADGSGYDPGVACGPKEQCAGSTGCMSLCAIYAQSPSSVGCSFFALNMDNFDEAEPDALVVGNTSATLTAVVNFYGSPNGVEGLLQGNVQIPPLAQHTFTIPNAASNVIDGVSALRKGGAFRVESDIPVVAYQHSPLNPVATNDASCLLPEATLGKRYFVPSYLDALGSYPSYFDVIATTDNTQVTITASNPTQAGNGISALTAGQTVTVTMNRYDTLQIINKLGNGNQAQRDLMGSEVSATAPVAVFGAVTCAQIPAGYTYCDHIEEQAIPTRNWGQTYVGAHLPKRSNSERYYWRVMAQEDATTITTTPAQTGFPLTLNKGKFYEFWTQTSFIFTGDKPFAAFQYMTGQDAFGAGTGDPAMVTAVPVEQFLNRYVILTPSGYSSNFVQIIRTTNDDVTVDGVTVPQGAYSALGAYTVADYAVGAGPHVVLSNSPIGIVGVGFTGVTSYGYPGGLALNNIAPN